MPSTPQTVTLTTVFDYILTDAGAAMPNVTVRCILDNNASTVIAPAVLLNPLELRTTTDGNGYFQFSVVPTDNINPANCTYTIVTPFRTYQIVVATGGPFQTTAVGTIVNVPVALAPATTNLTGPLTIATGPLTVSAGGAIIAGGVTISSGNLTISTGGFTMAGPLTLTAAASQIIPGATSFAVRNTGNSANNLLVSNAGLVTARAGLVATAGGLTVSAGGAAITGNSSVTGTLTSSGALTVSAGGMAVTGNSTITGTLGVTALLTAQAALTISAGVLTLGAAASQIVPGATSLSLRNHANSQDNLLLSDAGVGTMRNALSIPPSASGTVPTTAYGSLPVKIDDQLLVGSVASITFVNPLPTGFRHLLIEWYARGDTAAGNIGVIMRLNNDSAANYDQTYTWEVGAAAFGNNTESLGATSIHVGFCAAATATAAYFGQGTIQIKNYGGTTGNKLAINDAAWTESNLTGKQNRYFGMGKWRTTATAITRVDLLPVSGNFVAGSLFTLYGIP